MLESGGAPQQKRDPLYGQAIQLLGVGSESPGVPISNQPFVSPRHSATTDPVARRSAPAASRGVRLRYPRGLDQLLGPGSSEPIASRPAAELPDPVGSLLVEFWTAQSAPGIAHCGSPTGHPGAACHLTSICC